MLSTPSLETRPGVSIGFHSPDPDISTGNLSFTCHMILSPPQGLIRPQEVGLARHEGSIESTNGRLYAAKGILTPENRSSSRMGVILVSGPTGFLKCWGFGCFPLPRHSLSLLRSGGGALTQSCVLPCPAIPSPSQTPLETHHTQCMNTEKVE